jgi:hypothetical protein
MPLAPDDVEAHGHDPLDERLAFGLQIVFGGGYPEPPEQVIYEFKRLAVLVVKRVDHQSDLVRCVNQLPKRMQELRLGLDDDPAVPGDLVSHLRQYRDLGAKMSDLLPELVNLSLPVRRSDSRLELGPSDIDCDYRSGDRGDERGQSANETDKRRCDHVRHSPGQPTAKFVMSLAMAQAISA